MRHNKSRMIPTAKKPPKETKVVRRQTCPWCGKKLYSLVSLFNCVVCKMPVRS